MAKRLIRKDFLKALSLLAISGCVYLNFEPVVTEAASTNDEVTVTQVVDAEISITSPTDVSMSGNIGGVTGGTASGSAAWTVKTNNAAGFELKIKAGANPALQSGGNSFANYTRAGAVPDYAWSIANTDSEFGYTVNGATVADMVANFKDDGAGVCGGAGTLNTTNTSCWDAIATTDTTIISRSTPTSSSGEAESVTFQAQSGTSHTQSPGTYTATITVTATTL